MTAARLVVRADEVVGASSSVLLHEPRGIDVGSEYDEAVWVLREQREAATCLTALRLADLENALEDVFMAQSTTPRRTWLFNTLGMRIPVWSEKSGSCCRGRRSLSALS